MRLHDAAEVALWNEWHLVIKMESTIDFKSHSHKCAKKKDLNLMRRRYLEAYRSAIRRGVPPPELFSREQVRREKDKFKLKHDDDVVEIPEEKLEAAPDAVAIKTESDAEPLEGPGVKRRRDEIETRVREARKRLRLAAWDKFPFKGKRRRVVYSQLRKPYLPEEDVECVDIAITETHKALYGNVIPKWEVFDDSVKKILGLPVATATQ